MKKVTQDFRENSSLGHHNLLQGKVLVTVTRCLQIKRVVPQALQQINFTSSGNKHDSESDISKTTTDLFSLQSVAGDSDPCFR